MGRRTCIIPLIVTIACFQSAFVAADIISTGFAGGNGQAGNMFDIDVIATGGIEISQIDLNLNQGDWDVELYTKPGTYVGSETTPGDWTLHDSLFGLTSSGTNLASAWDIADLRLAPGQYAFYVNLTNGAGLNYTNGTAEGSVEASNDDLVIFEGTGNMADFGNQFRPRVWNGNIVYAVIPEPTASLCLACVAGIAGVQRRRRPSCSIAC